jgi:hypothetical protein
MGSYIYRKYYFLFSSVDVAKFEINFKNSWFVNIFIPFLLIYLVDFIESIFLKYVHNDILF